MTTEREYHEWQNKRRRKSKKRQANTAGFWLLSLVLLSGYVYYSSEQQFFSSELINKLITQPKNFSQEWLKSSFADFKPGTANQLKNINYKEIDARASSLQYDGTSVKELAALLSSSATTEAEKARIIYSWIAFNIAYDAPGYFSGDYGDLSPEGVLKTRQAVCSGYADLYKALANAMGLDAVVIEGYAKGASYAIGSKSEVNHAWNAVKINQGWYLIDSTWGAGGLNGKEFNKNFNTYYFATPPNQFIYSHLPSNKNWQLLSKPYSQQQFESWPEVSDQFFKNNLKLSSHKSHTIYTNQKLKVLLEAPQDVLALAKLQSNSQTLGNNSTYIRKEGNKIAIYASFPQPGTYELSIFSTNKQEPGYYQQALKYQVISN